MIKQGNNKGIVCAIPSNRTYHGKVDMIPILERIQKTDQPRRLGSRQDISLDENMLDFVHLG
jgi:hypothetical protein